MALRSSQFTGRFRPQAGFTLLELAVVVTILGIISGIALPSYQRIQRNTRFGALMNDYRVFAGAFQQYSAINATWPIYGGATGDFPQGMEPYLRTTNWNQPTVFGGHYNWDRDVIHNGRKVKAAIAIYAAEGRPLTMTDSEMQLFDRRFDDGDLVTGTFQRGFGNSPLYIIEDDSAAAPAAVAPAVPEATPSVLEDMPDAGEEAGFDAPLRPPEKSDDNGNKGKNDGKGKAKGKQGK